MKRLLLGLMLLAATAASAEWTDVGGNDQFIQYVDRDTIRRNGNFVKMWDLVDFNSVQTSSGGKSYLSSKTQLQYDCKEERSQMLAFLWFDGKMGNGKVVVSGSDPDKWSPISPRSASEALWKIACGK